MEEEATDSGNSPMKETDMTDQSQSAREGGVNGKVRNISMPQTEQELNAEIEACLAPENMRRTVMSYHPKCPQCGEEATYQTPDGTFWDSSAHFWREASEKAKAAAARQSAREMVELAEACELYAKVHGSNIIVVENDWEPGDPERIEPRDTLRKAAAALRLAAQAAPGEPVAWREALVNALREAERFMAYFAGEEPYHFVGPGTPTSCLTQIRDALAALPQDGRDPATIEALAKALGQIEQISDICLNAKVYTAKDALNHLQGIRNIIKGLRADVNFPLLEGK